MVNGLEIDAWLRERIQKVRSLVATMCGYTAWCSIARLRLLFPACFRWPAVGQSALAVKRIAKRREGSRTWMHTYSALGPLECLL